MKLALVDFRITTEEKSNLEKLGCKVISCPQCPLLYPAISGHPDILVHPLEEKQVIVHRDMNSTFIHTIKSFGFEVLYTTKSLKDSYPFDIMLNAINLKKYFIHNLPYSDKTLLSHVSKKKLINVNQGYSKCSTAIVTDTALITSDKSIYRELTKENFDILLLPPGDIALPGLNYGFIGGTCGLLDNKLVFYGSLEKYKYGNLVLDFLEKHEVEPIYLSNSNLIDRGSIFFI